MKENDDVVEELKDGGEFSKLDEVLVELLVKLEDLFIDPFVLCDADDNDDEENDNNKDKWISKEGESLQQEMNEFNLRAAEEFCKFDDDNNSEMIEYSLLHSDLHRKFCEMIEGPLEEILSKYGFTINSFYEKMQAILADKDNSKLDDDDEGSWSKIGGIEVLNILHQVCDFEYWAKTMVKKAKSNLGKEQNKK